MPIINKSASNYVEYISKTTPLFIKKERCQYKSKWKG